MAVRGRPRRQAIYRQLAETVEELRSRLGGLPSPADAEDIWGDIWHQEAHHSTAIEGNTLVLREVEVLLREGRAVGDRELIATAAMIDRLVHHAKVVALKGDSYRLKDRVSAAPQRPRQRTNDG